MDATSSRRLARSRRPRGRPDAVVRRPFRVCANRALVPVPCRIERRGAGTRGAPGAPPLDTPRPPHENGAQRAGALGPASPSGNSVEAPAAALLPRPARRGFPKSRLPAGAMLISPMLFILARPRQARFTSRRRDRQGEVCAIALSEFVFQPQRREDGAAAAGASRHRRGVEQAEETRAPT